MKTIYFDMDGTIADLYSVPDWLPKLRAENPEPYANAAPLLNMKELTEVCQQLQKYGYRIAVVSWLSKEATANYKKDVRIAKRQWLERNFPIAFDELHIVQYGYSKRKTCGNVGDILIDDELGNILKWTGKKNDRQAFHVNKNSESKILDFLKKLLAVEQAN